MRKKGIEVAALFPNRKSVLENPGAPAAAHKQPTLGWIVALHRSESNEPDILVDFPGSPHGPLRARLATTATVQRLETAISERQPAVLIFENGDPLLPLIVGLVESGPIQEENKATVVEADVDGKRVRVVGQDEIVLECGEASITLRRNGRIVIRGAYVESHSEGTNRIKGGQVQIN